MKCVIFLPGSDSDKWLHRCIKVYCGFMSTCNDANAVIVGILVSCMLQFVPFSTGLLSFLVKEWNVYKETRLIYLLFDAWVFLLSKAFSFCRDYCKC